MLQRFIKLKIVVDEITHNPQGTHNISKKKIENLKALALTSNDWVTIEVLIKILKPVFVATIMLQGKSYPTLAIGQAIENLLFCFYDNIIRVGNTKDSVIARQLKHHLEWHLCTKISSKQKKITLVRYSF